MIRAFAIAVLVMALYTPAAFAQEGDAPVVLLESSSGVHEIEGRALLEVRGIRGTISLRLGPAGALRFEGRTLDSARAHRSVRLTLEEQTLVLGPGADVDEAGMLVDVVIPPDVKVVVDATDSKLLVGGLHSELFVRGDRVDARVRGVQAPVGFDVKRSTLAIEGVKGLTLGADETTAEVKYVYGLAELDMIGGQLKLEDAEQLAGYVEGLECEIRTVKGRAELETLGGKLVGAGFDGGGELRLQGTPLDLRRAKGGWQIETDAPVALEQIEGPLSVSSIGAELRGKQLGGPLRIDSDSATIVLEYLTGESEIHGTALQLSVQQVKEPLTIVTAGSQVEIRGTAKEVTIESDFGDVELAETQGLVTIKSRQGTVRVLAAEGPLQIEADGPLVEAGWKGFRGIENSTISNKSGDVKVLLPAGQRCYIEADAPHGRIESHLKDVLASEDGHSARGEHTGGAQLAPQVKKPVLQLTSGGGNIQLGVLAAE